MKTGITINDQPVEVPDNWGDVSFGQFLQLKDAKTDADTMSALTGIDLHICKNVAPEMINVILFPAADMGEIPSIDNPQILDKPVPTEIGKMECARKFNCDNLSRNYEDEEMIGRMVAIYMAKGIKDEDIESTYKLILDEPLPNVVSAGKILSDQLQELRKREEKIPEPEYESEEFSAGISEFKKYGVWGVVRGVALRHYCTMDDVFKWSYNKLLLELQYSAEENRYQRKLNRMYNSKK